MKGNYKKILFKNFWIKKIFNSYEHDRRNCDDGSTETEDFE